MSRALEKVLIVEDDEDIREVLVFNLRNEGYIILEAATGLEGVELARQELPDILLLDIMLPEMDGLSVCKELALSPDTAGIPIIILTARGDEVDRIEGFEQGAADYVVKPFSVRELLLRVRAVLKRYQPKVPVPEHIAGGGTLQGQGGGVASGVLAVGSISMDLHAHVVQVEGTPVELTATEFRLLEHCMRNSGTVLAREQLLEAVWGYQFEGYARTVDTHVRRLRAKLGGAASLLETVRGFGYRFAGS